MKNLICTSMICAAAFLTPYHLQGVESAFEKGNYSFTGTLYPQHMTKVSAQVQGRLLDMLVDVGDSVKKGQVVALIDPLFYEMDLRKTEILAERAKISYQECEVDFTRMKKLWEKQEGEGSAISKKQYEDSLNRFQQHKLAYDEALVELQKAKILLEETRLKAPYDGVITQKYVDPGEAITLVPVTPIYEIMDVSSLHFEFSLPQDLLSVVREGQEIILDKTGIGVIEKIFPNIDVSSRSFRCRVIVENGTHHLKPGAFVKGALPLKKPLFQS